MRPRIEESSPQSSVTIRRNPSRRAHLTASKATSNPSISAADDCSSLKVFLRVRPLSVKSCVVVNDFHSVTITPPLCDSATLNSQLYSGFSHVFSPHSSQDEVYNTMMKPIVDQFLNGRSALLAALGPSGSGKTHTVFGSPKHPGLLPRALHHIFNIGVGDKSTSSSRSFYLSVFEISMDKGKGEKLFDLSPDGGHIYMQQSLVKGLKEVLIKDVAHAEALLAAANLKRATAITNSNNQSSRSQCIIKLRCAINGTDLTFVDLAGAERERKTGNQGGRLLESNFINNTSMVFGLCLRSLLEHQKNPKKPLQKHFQSSLLTRFLRDYLEGRKRMALILTARSGPEDYFDVSFLLKQTSPYMEIKFNNVEETSKLPGNKRRNQRTCSDKQKRVKMSSEDEKNEAGRTTGVSNNFNCKDVSNEIHGYSMLGGSETAPAEVDNPNAKLQRDYYIMQGFAKALWSVLKQYKERVKVMQNEIDLLTEKMSTGHDGYLAMEKELHLMKSNCSCTKQLSINDACTIGDKSSEASFLKVDNIKPKLPQREVSEQRFELSAHQVPQNGSEEIQIPGPTAVHIPDSSTAQTSAFIDDKTELDGILKTPFRGAAVPSCDIESSVQHNLQAQCSPMKCENSHDRVCIDDSHDNDATKKNGEILTETGVHSRKSHIMDLKVESENNGNRADVKKDKENSANSPQSNFKSKLETKEMSHKPLKQERPKRRLMPASSALLMDISLDSSYDDVKHRVGKGGQRLAENESKSRGNATLLRLLKNHLPR